QSLEVSLLIRKDFLKSCLSLFLCLSTDHLTESVDSSLAEEHMLCTAETDTLSAKLNSFLSVFRCISVCADFHSSVLVSPVHDTSELTGDRSVYCRDDSVVDVTCCTIDRDCISLVELFSAKSEFLVSLVHND